MVHFFTVFIPGGKKRMKSYIVRIYRGEIGGSRQLLGTVERPGGDVKLAFTSFDELKGILSSHAGKDVFAEACEWQKGRKSNQETGEAGGPGSKANQGQTMESKENETEEG